MAATIKTLVNTEVEVYIASCAGNATRQKGVLESVPREPIFAVSCGASSGGDGCVERS